MLWGADARADAVKFGESGRILENSDNRSPCHIVAAHLATRAFAINKGLAFVAGGNWYPFGREACRLSLGRRMGGHVQRLVSGQCLDSETRLFAYNDKGQRGNDFANYPLLSTRSNLMNARQEEITLKNKSLMALAAPLAAGLMLSFSAMPIAAVQAASATTNIVVGADTTFPPFESEKNGKVTGFDIDMIRAIAKAENMTVSIKTLPFNGIIPSLQAGSIDAAVAGITIKTSRMKNVNFSDAYYKSGLSILVKTDSKIKDFADLKGHVVATKKATSSVDYLTSKGFPEDHIKQFQSIDSAYQALETGGADAVVFDNPVNVAFKNSQKNVKIVGPLLTGEYYGIAVSKRKPKLAGEINAGLAKIKKSGEYAKLFKTYFGGDMSGAVKGVEKPASVAITD